MNGNRFVLIVELERVSGSTTKVIAESHFIQAAGEAPEIGRVFNLFGRSVRVDKIVEDFKEL